MKRSPLKRVGRRTKADQLELAEAHIALAYRCHGRCEICAGPFQVKHHRASRGSEYSVLRNDASNLMALCTDCHAKIHSFPIWARELGYLQ